MSNKDKIPFSYIKKALDKVKKDKEEGVLKPSSIDAFSMIKYSLIEIKLNNERMFNFMKYAFGVVVLLLMVSVGFNVYQHMDGTKYVYSPNGYVMKTGSLLMKIDSQELLDALKKNDAIHYRDRLKLGTYLELNHIKTLLANNEESFNMKFTDVQPYSGDSFSVMGISFPKEKVLVPTPKKIKCEMIYEQGLADVAMKSNEINDNDKKLLGVGSCIAETNAIPNYKYAVYPKGNIADGSMAFARN